MRTSDLISLVFRILPDLRCGTERATLDLRSGADGMWWVAQLYGAANAPGSRGTRRFVAVWLFLPQCDQAASSQELLRSCLAELAAAGLVPAA
ncbi:MAG TPA: hypothetical protein VIM11_04695 [Tepidisphaeraceae bacterium]